jgi:1-deoxy-D-xylulose-5-phosphate reductoisomerase
LKSNFKRFSFLDYPTLSFEQPDMKNFRNLALAFGALTKGGNSPCVLNASNEIAVDAFLNNKIGFLQMSDIIEKAIEEIKFIAKPSYEDCIETDLETRRFSQHVINKLV